MKLFNSFTGGTMNKDLEVRLLPKSIYLDAQNVRIVTPDAQNSRSVKLPLGNTLATALSLGANPKCVGSTADGFSNKIYWAVKSDTGSYICEYDTDTDVEDIILGDTRSASTRVLDLPLGGYVEMRVLNDNDNGRNFLFLTDGVNEPLYFEIEAARALPDNGFSLLNVSLIKAAPFSAPELTLGNTASEKENNIEVKFLSFAYSYEYANGEVSALSPFSEFAFKPSAFSYDYGSSTNKSMFNDFSKVTVTFDTGVADVVGINIVVKESGSNTAWVVESFDKANESWGDSVSQTFEFSNSKTLRALDSKQLTRAFDNVPTRAKTLELIGNRIVFGNYTEGYDILNSSSQVIHPSFTLGYTATAGTAGDSHNQVKSNRDYEILIAYVDGKGRMTTPLSSEGNDTFVENQDSNKKNQLQVTISSEAPEFATGYRFFVKQSKRDYDVLVPLTFYRDGINAWIKVEGNDGSKVDEGDFVYVKSDTSGIKSTTIRTKILEVKEQDRNFLETDATIIAGAVTHQLGGVYIKVEVKDFSLSESAVTNFLGETTYAFRSANTTNNFFNGVNYVEYTYYDGVDLDDLTNNDTYSFGDDIRYEIEITATGAPDTFQWREFNVSTGVTGAYTTGVAITGAAQALSNSLTITFGATTGHTVNDKWFISCKSATRVQDWNKGGTVSGDGRRAIMLFESKDTNDESIKAGAAITLTYDDSSSGSNVQDLAGLVTEALTASQDYPNLEEWFYGDNIISAMSYPANVTSIMFRRGVLQKANGEQMSVTDKDGRLYMAMLSQANYTGSGGSEVRIDTSISITELNNNIILETIPIDENSDIVFELPKTYTIVSGNHIGDGGADVNQIFGSTSAVINLDYFNSFGWYNGFESIKIGDTFNENVMLLDTKPLIPIENYKAITRIASLTYSDVYESTTQFNALNEFNLAEVNYKDLDTRYGSIQKLHTQNTDLVVFQEDKTHDILFAKSVLYNADGTGNITQSSKVLGQEIAKTGEYGIGTHPESFAFFGNNIYHLDKSRGALMRLSLAGYDEISKAGFLSYFRTLTTQVSFVGGYDPYNDEYLLNVAPDGSPLTVAFTEGALGGFTSFYEFQPERLLGVNNRLYSIKDGQIYLHDSNTTRNNFYGVQRTASITAVFNDSPDDVKHWKSLNIESTNPWKAEITTSLGIGTIETSEFSLEEGEYYGYIRQNEDTSSTAGIAAFKGLGNVQGISLGDVTYAFELPRSLSIGDVLYNLDVSDNPVQIGTILTIDRDTNTINISNTTGLSVSDYTIYGKDVRVEGEAIKGYHLEVVLTNTSSTDEELFAIKAEAVRSFD